MSIFSKKWRWRPYQQATTVLESQPTTSATEVRDGYPQTPPDPCARTRKTLEWNHTQADTRPLLRLLLHQILVSPVRRHWRRFPKPRMYVRVPMPPFNGSITNESYIPPLNIPSVAPSSSIVFRPPPPVNVVDDEETNRRYRHALEAKQKKWSDIRKEMGLTCVPPTPTMRKNMRKKLTPAPIKAVAEGRAAAPTPVPLAPVSHNTVAGRDRAPSSPRVATAVPSSSRPAPAPSSLDYDSSTSINPQDRVLRDMRQVRVRQGVGESILHIRAKTASPKACKVLDGEENEADDEE